MLTNIISLFFNVIVNVFTAYTYGPESGTVLFIFVFLVMAVFLLEGKKLITFSLLFIISSFFVVMYINKNIPSIYTDIPEYYDYLNPLTAFCLTLILIVIMKNETFRYQRQIEQSNVAMKELNLNLNNANVELHATLETIEQQKSLIEKHNQQTTDSIQYARRIQMAILPPVQAIIGNKNYFIFWQPRDIVSGDFYWFHRHNDTLFVAAADCTGHGVPGAFMSMLGISALNDVVIKRGIETPSVILDELRLFIKEALRQQGEQNEQKDGMDIAFCAIQNNTNMVQYAGAHNSLYIVSNQQLIEIKANRQPVGIHIKETPFTNNEYQANTNDMLYLCSDGFVSQTGGNRNETFKTNRLKALFEQIASDHVEQQHQTMSQTFNQWQGKNEQIDDVLVIGIRL